MLVAGKWVDSERRITVRNPFDGSVVGTVPAAEVSHVSAAVTAAIEGQRKLASATSRDRASMLRGIGERISAAAEELARLLALEVGKTLREARYEVNRASETFLLASEEAKRITGETVPFDAAPGGEGKWGFYTRVPLGVVIAITPFNFPLSLAAHKVAPALAAGNAVILKPSPSAPMAALRLGQFALEAGVPPTAFSVVTGGAEVGEALVVDDRPRMVSFTGSLRVGKVLAREAGVKKVTLELGSNSAVVLLGDADLERAVPRIVAGGYAVAGQVCISVQRVLVHRDLQEELLARLADASGKLRTGNPLDEGVEMGPMISQDAASRALGLFRDAVDSGGRIVAGGEGSGTMVQPTIIIDPPLASPVWREEAFCPVLCVRSFVDLDEAIELVNDSPYGLQTGVYTNRLDEAFSFADRVESGAIMVNEVPTYRVDLMPYGGVKGSGVGREGVRHAIGEMSETKLICLSL